MVQGEAASGLPPDLAQLAASLDDNVSISSNPGPLTVDTTQAPTQVRFLFGVFNM